MRYGHTPEEIDRMPWRDVVTFLETLELFDPLTFGGQGSP